MASWVSSDVKNGTCIAGYGFMIKHHLDILPSGWPQKSSTAQGGKSSAAFQQTLDQFSSGKGGLPVPGEKLDPAMIKSLALHLLTALERASMSAMLGDSQSSYGSSQPKLFSTDLFMSMQQQVTRSPSQSAPVAQVRAPESAPVASLEKPGIEIPVSQAPVQAAEVKPAASVSGSVKSEPVEVSVADTASDAVKEEVAERQPVRSGKAQFASIVAKAAEQHGLDPKLIEAVIQTESSFQADAVSPVGAQGLMQLMPATAADLGVKDAFDPEQNVMAGSKYLKQLMNRYDGDAKLALAAYNWGMGNLERNPERMPQETIQYVAKITRLMEATA